MVGKGHAQLELARLRGWFEVMRIAPVRVVSFLVLAAGTALCQNEGQPLPDAPSVQAEIPQPTLKVFIEEARTPLRFEAISQVRALRQDEFAVPGKAFSHKESNAASNAPWNRYLSPPVEQSAGNPSNNASLTGRAIHAASGIFVTRDDSGRSRLNTSYLLRTLTSVAADTASRPYWRRSFSQPFSDFGATVGNHAGMNVWHQFEPGIQQLMKTHAPRFVNRVEERIGHN